MLRQRQQSGYTLLELLTAIAIAGVLLVVGVPSYRYLVTNNRATSQANAFLSLITFARTEAIRSNRTVGLCKTTDGSTCSSASSGWETGVLVFAFNDANANGVLDSGEAMTIVRAEVPFARSSTIVGNATATANRYFYQPNGRGSGNGSFVITPNNASAAQIRSIVMTAGRARIKCPNSSDLQC